MKKYAFLLVLLATLLIAVPTAAQDPIELVGVDGFANSCIPDNNIAGFTVRFNVAGEVTVLKQAYTDFLRETEVIRSTSGGGDVVRFTMNAKELPENTVVQFTISNGGEQSVAVAVNCTTGEVYNRRIFGPDGRLNAGNDLPVVIYPRLNRSGEPFLDFYTSPDGERGIRTLTVDADTLADLPENPESNREIATTRDGLATLYKLTSGEYQVNYQPTAEGKVPVVIFDALSPSYIVREDFRIGG